MFILFYFPGRHPEFISGPFLQKDTSAELTTCATKTLIEIIVEITTKKRKILHCIQNDIIKIRMT